MKKTLALLLVILCITLAACSGPINSDPKTVRRVSFKGTELTVTLGTNKSTGYEWDYEIYGDCIKPSINRTFKVTGGNATGETSIGFEGISDGDAAIVFTPPSGWDGTDSGDGYTVTVTVDKDGTILSAEGAEGASAPTEKTELAVSEIKEGSYTGTLSGCNYTTVSDDNTCKISPTISPAEITVTIKDGQVTLYCAAEVCSDGEVYGVQSPRSPVYTQTVSGSLPLSQPDEITVCAEGDLTLPIEVPKIYWENKKFDRWDIETEDRTYHCKVSIAMSDGIPTAMISVNGASSGRTAVVELALS